MTDQLYPCRHCGITPIITVDPVSDGAYVHSICCRSNEYYQGKNITIRCYMGDDITIRTTARHIESTLVNLWNELNKPVYSVEKDFLRYLKLTQPID